MVYMKRLFPDFTVSLVLLFTFQFSLFYSFTARMHNKSNRRIAIVFCIALMLAIAIARGAERCAFALPPLL